MVTPRSYRARTKFRDYDGVTRDVEAWGITGAAAERALKEKLRDRTQPSAGDLTGNTRMSQLATLWIEEVEAEGRIAPQTIDRYQASIRRVVQPAFGGLRVRECTVSRMDRALKAVAERHPGEARGARVVLGLMLGMAVRHGALPANPVRDIGRLRKNRNTVKALATNDLNTVRSAIRQWQTPATPRPGPRPANDLADIVDLLLATGSRIGEVLAVRWADIDNSADPPALTISGTLVYVRGRGTFRQAWTKSDAGFRTVFLPMFAVEMLERRRAGADANEHDAVFASRNRTWLMPNNVRRQWRAARKDTGLDWVTPHTFRKTVATLIDHETDTDTAAAQLGHKSGEITKAHYIQKAHRAPDVTSVLDALGPDTATSA
jgi:integrase